MFYQLHMHYTVIATPNRPVVVFVEEGYIAHYSRIGEDEDGKFCYIEQDCATLTIDGDMLDSPEMVALAKKKAHGLAEKITDMAYAAAKRARRLVHEHEGLACNEDCANCPYAGVVATDESTSIH